MSTALSVIEVKKIKSSANGTIDFSPKLAQNGIYIASFNYENQLDVIRIIKE